MRNYTVTVVLMLGTALFAAGCGQKVGEKVAEKAIELAARSDGEKVDVDLDTDKGGFSMTVKGEDGKDQKMELKSTGDGDNFAMTVRGEDGEVSMVFGDAASIPADFPKDVPLFPGMKPTMVQSHAQEKMHMVVAHADKPIAEVAGFFKKQCASQGWTEQMQMTQGDARVMSYQKGERVLNVTLAAEDGGTSISLHAMAQ